ncbi:MAG TPA: VRR-NUC domain-containing protein [Caldimonas sp.]|nr:VRR-NUC domain-containing protein [Caldimonas sp.]
MTRRQAAARSAQREAPILRAVHELLQYHPKVAKVWRQNSGAMKIDDRYIQFSSELGLPDLGGFLKDGRALWIECKSPTGKLTYHQRRFLEDARRAGCVAGVARCVEDAQALISGQLLAF